MIVLYNKLLKYCDSKKIDVYEIDLINKGLYSDGIIALSNRMSTSNEKACILAEELGHYHTTVGDILDQSKAENRKQERRARAWAYALLVPFEALIEAFEVGIIGRHDLAEFLGITEEYLQQAINYYRDKYGVGIALGDYIIYFDPLGVMKII